MTLERVGNDLYATGPTVEQDFVSSKEALATGGIERLILVNGPGGDLWTGIQVAYMVRDAKIKTVVSGFCMSACSLIFVAGQERAFGTGHLPRATLLGIHGAHNKVTKQVNPQAMPQMYALYKRQLGDKFDSQVMSQALYEIKEASGFLRLRELERNVEKDQTPWFCPTGQTPFDECQKHPGKDALSLGFVTQKNSEVLELPTSMQTQLEFYGRRLSAPNLNWHKRVDELIQAGCNGRVPCKTAAEMALQKFLDATTNKAMAIGWNAPGYGMKWGDDDARTAMLRALYQCNHTPRNPKLCRLVSVNDQEILPIYEETQKQADALLIGLRAVAPELTAREREEPGGGVPSKLRTGNQTNGMTPRSLEGIHRLATELAQALAQNDRPVLIDVAAIGPMIPSAINLIHAGLAFEESKLEMDFADRFRRMLTAAAPDMKHPLVFYCANSECWTAVNAAMRARQLGYERVMWYRGGLATWTQAGLPTVGRAPLAILN